MDEAYKKAVADVFEGPTLGSTAMIVGLRVAIRKACEKYGVDDLKDESVPGDLREFVANTMEASTRYVEDACNAFEID